MDRVLMHRGEPQIHGTQYQVRVVSWSCGQCVIPPVWTSGGPR